MDNKYSMEKFRVSPSSLRLYFNCSGAWRRRYLDKIAPPRTGKTAAVMGSCFHEMMELYDQKKEPNSMGVMVLIKKVIRASRDVDINQVNLDKFQNELMELVEIGKRMSKKWEGFKVHSLEGGIEFPYKFNVKEIKNPIIKPQSFTVYGKIDKVLLNKKVPIIFDWKTSGKLKTEEEYEDDAQATMYIALAAKKFKVPVEEVLACFVYPKFDEVIWTQRTKAQCDAFWENEIDHFIRGVLQGNFRDIRCDNCKWCDFKSSCHAV